MGLDALPLQKFHTWFYMWKTSWTGTFSLTKFLFHVWNHNVLINEIPNSYVKWPPCSRFQMWHLVLETCFINKIDLLMKINFAHEILIQLMELKLFYIWNTVFICEMKCEIFLRDHYNAMSESRYCLRKQSSIFWLFLLFTSFVTIVCPSSLKYLWRHK